MCSNCNRCLRESDGQVLTHARVLPGGLVIYERRHATCPPGGLYIDWSRATMVRGVQ